MARKKQGKDRALKDHRERRSGKDRRRGGDRRSEKERRSGEERRRGEMHEMYRTDLDRHFWSLPGSAARSRKRRRKEVSRKRKVARFMGGAIGAVSLAYYVYRRWRGDELAVEEDPEEAEADEEQGSQPDPGGR